MGQLVAVEQKPSPLPGVVRFELNRALTGMGHERFRNSAEAVGPTPAAELARRLFATDQVDAVHVYSNMVTVDLAKGRTADGLSDVVRNLYRYWYPGMAPPSFEDLEPAADEATAPTEGAAAVGARRRGRSGARRGGKAGPHAPPRTQPCRPRSLEGEAGLIRSVRRGEGNLVANGPGGDLGAAGQAELGQDVGHVDGGRLRRDEQPVRQLTIGQPIGEQRRHFPLA